MKQFVGYLIKKAIGKGKVSPTIKSVKPSPTVMKKGAQASVDKVKSDEYLKRIRELDKAEGKIKSGKQMMKEGQKSRKKMIDTKRAFQFKHGKSTHPIKPGDKPEIKYKGNVREQKMGGGMMGRRMGYSEGKLAVTPREKKLAAQYGDKKRITRGDIITIAKKKSGNKNV
jgi:hypothetical protein